MIIFFILFSFCLSQTIYTDYLVVSGDTIDVFSYQIPENYNPNNPHPLLVAFHQWGGNENSNYSTEFDEESNNRNWIMLSPYGGSSNNYNHQGAQDMVQGEIEWMMNHFNFDSQTIQLGDWVTFKSSPDIWKIMSMFREKNQLYCLATCGPETIFLISIKYLAFLTQQLILVCARPT